MSRPAPSAPEVVAMLRAAGCVFAEEEARLLLAESAVDGLADLVDRRVAGEPLEHVLGWAEFCGLRVAVDTGVFVPRRRTEHLARTAIALARTAGAREPVVVDLCCGSGAVGAAVLAGLDRVELHAADIDAAAVRCARGNLGERAHVYGGDLFDALPGTLRRRVDVLVANVPYVPSGEIALLPPEARIHEPARSLDGGNDGLDMVRRLATAGPLWLRPGGHLLVETSERQADVAASIFATRGLLPRVSRAEAMDAVVVLGSRRRLLTCD